MHCGSTRTRPAFFAPSPRVPRAGDHSGVGVATASEGGLDQPLQRREGGGPDAVAEQEPPPARESLQGGNQPPHELI